MKERRKERTKVKQNHFCAVPWILAKSFAFLSSRHKLNLLGRRSLEMKFHRVPNVFKAQHLILARSHISINYSKLDGMTFSSVSLYSWLWKLLLGIKYCYSTIELILSFLIIFKSFFFHLRKLCQKSKCYFVQHQSLF